MKKLIAILMAAAMMLALAGCSGSNNATNVPSTADEAAKAIKTDDYAKTFSGFIKCLLDKGYILSKDGNGSSLKTSLYYDYIGAGNGVRYYTPDQAGFVEIYDFSGELNDTAKTIVAAIKDKGEFTSVEGMDKMKADISPDGTIVIAYSASAKHANYDKIKEVLAGWK